MPIVDLQRKLRQLGRIRAGEVVETATGKRRPSKLEHFRITSHSEPIIRQVAELYGGTPTQWSPQNSQDQQWQVTVDVDRIPILVPPQSISQHYELWSGGGCVRRCDGEREQKSGGPCLCSPDPKRRECAVTTRLSVILREVQGLGVFRLDSKGFYAASELPQVAEFLEHAGSFVEAYLALEPRKDVQDGKTRHWMTPVLDVDITPQQVLAAGAGTAGQLGVGTQHSITPPTTRPELTAGSPPPGVTVIDPDSVAQVIDGCATPDELRVLWQHLGGNPVLNDPANAEVAAHFKTHARKIKPPDEKAPANAQEGPPPPETGGAPDADAVWQQVLAAAPKDWTSEQLEGDVAEKLGVSAEDASAEQLTRYLELSRGPS